MLFYLVTFNKMHAALVSALPLRFTCLNPLNSHRFMKIFPFLIIIYILVAKRDIMHHLLETYGTTMLSPS